MDDKGKGKVKKETEGSVAPAPRKGLKFAPKKPPKKPAKVVLKTEPVEEIKDETIDKELLMKLKTSQKQSIHRLHLGKGTLPMQNRFLHDIIQQGQKHQKNMSIHGTITIVIILLLSRLGGLTLEILKFLMKRSLGESSASRAQDGELTAAEELGLMDRSNTPQLLFFQFPSFLPLPKQAQSVEEPNTGNKENADPASTSSKLTHEKTWPSSFTGSKIKDLPGGLMGKILVYKGGKVKMKIGDALFDVYPGVNFKFVQEVAAINTRENHCCTLGEISKHAVVTPDLDYLLDSVDRMKE